jgi:very-long-chain enoyl-CoA reductase
MMASKTIVLKIRPRGNVVHIPKPYTSQCSLLIGKPIPGLPEELSTLSTAPASDLYNKLATQSKFSIHRLRLTKGSDGAHVPSTKDSSISSTGLRDQSTIYVKDLGLQVSWRTVFIVEYLGPLLIHPLIYTLRPSLYPSAPAEPSELQSVTCVLIVLHFLKREAETIFVHRFSSATMPVRNMFRNSAYYWVLNGANIAVWIYRPGGRTAAPTNLPILLAGLALYTVGELWNLYTHLVLRSLRSTGGSERGIPKGLGFGLVTCPNYMTEMISWIGVWLVSGLSWSVLLFVVVSGGQMMIWGKKKEARYRREFGDKYKNKRFTMLPGIG